MLSDRAYLATDSAEVSRPGEVDGCGACAARPAAPQRTNQRIRRTRTRIPRSYRTPGRRGLLWWPAAPGLYRSLRRTSRRYLIGGGWLFSLEGGTSPFIRRYTTTLP